MKGQGEITNAVLQNQDREQENRKMDEFHKTSKRSQKLTIALIFNNKYIKDYVFLSNTSNVMSVMQANLHFKCPTSWIFWTKIPPKSIRCPH